MYFKYVRARPDRQGIRDVWIEQTIQSPEARQVQSAGEYDYGSGLLKQRVAGYGCCCCKTERPYTTPFSIGASKENKDEGEILL